MAGQHVRLHSGTSSLVVEVGMGEEPAKVGVPAYSLTEKCEVIAVRKSNLDARDRL
jgi:hypothetical protein